MVNKEKICPICGKCFVGRSYGAHVSSAHTIRTKMKRSLKTKQCIKCGKDFTVEFILNKNGEWKCVYDKKFCSKQCANSHIQTDIQNKNRRIKLKGQKHTTKRRIFLNPHNVSKTCPMCGKVFYNSRKVQCCSKKCGSKFGGLKGGLVSSHNQQKRSKNEIEFFNLCKKFFDCYVIHNKKMFNGWDADIIITKYKIAILWNGQWHLKKITHKHSLEQVQNRDKIKIKNIKQMNYIPYVINDYGKFNVNLVKNEFFIFLKFVDSLCM